MRRAKARYLLLAVAVSLIVITSCPATAAAEDELAAGRFVLNAPDGRILLRTGIVVSEGDWLIASDGSVYRVTALSGTQVQLATASLSDITYSSPVSPLVWPATTPWTPAVVWAGNRVAVYSTHGDEVVRGVIAVAGAGGAESIPVLDTADSFAAEATSRGLRVTIDTTSHWPHDGDAYRRSQFTARDLLRGRPDVMLDWQTDSAPVAGEPPETPACLLVIGGSSPRLKTNLGFACALMSAANVTAPGAVKGTLVCHGEYAQVYYPASVVVLAGTAADDHNTVDSLAVTLAGALSDLHDAALRSDRGETRLYLVSLGLAMLFQRLTRRRWPGRWR